MSLQQTSLFGSQPQSCMALPMPDADVTLYPAFFSDQEAAHYFDALRQSLLWQQDDIKLYGRKVKIPRLQAWYGDKEAHYAYSGLQMVPNVWTPELQHIRQTCEQVCNTRFNSVLANLYRDGQDSMGWHSDDEPELGQRPVIASVSFGQVRDLDFRHKISGQKQRLSLPHGSLLIMAGDTQQYWQHGISKRARIAQERINLTFRMIHQVEK